MNTNKEPHSVFLHHRSVESPKVTAGSLSKGCVRLCGFVFIRVHSWFLIGWIGFGLLLTLAAAFAETADDIFHGGVVNYLSNNIPKALEVVTNGRALYPDDIKLKKLEELLKQQNQQQQQQQQQKDEQQKQDEKKDQQKQDQQSKQDQKEEQKKKDEEKKQAEMKEQEQKQDQQQAKQSDDKSKEQPEDKQQQMAAHAMTPQEAKQLLDAQKGDEKVLQFVPQGEPKHLGRILKDW